MKNAIYWFFRHYHYNKIIKDLLTKQGFLVTHVSSYMTKTGTSKTYIYGLMKAHGLAQGLKIRPSHKAIEIHGKLPKEEIIP